jgi:hypothetical protein
MRITKKGRRISKEERDTGGIFRKYRVEVIKWVCLYWERGRE